jgi:hypothetical protein
MAPPLIRRAGIDRERQGRFTSRHKFWKSSDECRGGQPGTPRFAGDREPLSGCVEGIAYHG